MLFNKKTIIILIALFLGFVIALMPASVALSILPDSVGLKANGVRGTIWNGSAARVQMQRQTLDRVRWELSPWSLLMGKLGLTLSVKDKALPTRGNLALGFGGSIGANSINTKINAAMLEPYINMRGVNLAGTIMLDITDFAYAEPQLKDADLEINWLQAQVTTQFGTAGLGDMVIKIKKLEDGILQARVVETADVTGMDAVFTLKADGSISAKGEMKAEVEQSLQLVANMLGKRQGDKIAIDYNAPAGIIPLPKNLQF